MKERREALELSQDRLAELAGMTQAQVNRLENGKRKMTPEWANMLSPHLNVSPVDLVFPDLKTKVTTLKIVGRVGASIDGKVLQDTDQGPFGEVIAPLGASGNEVAVEVAGPSMGTYAPDGSLILYNDRRDPPREDMIGEVCIVGLPGGEVLVKKLLRGSKRGLFNLDSLVGDTMKDQRVDWAAVVLVVVHPRQARRLRIG